MDELQVTVAKYDVSIVYVSEPWLKDYMGENSIALHGFCMERTDRDHCRTGGVACYIRNDTSVRIYPECGVILTGDFNQLNENFLITHFRFIQVVNVPTRGQAILDKIRTNMGEEYTMFK